MEKPNILFFLSDQHKCNILGAYSDKIINTPNLDQLAQEGTSLDTITTKFNYNYS